VLPGMELMSCPNLAVPREVMHHVVRVESSYNPYAIGVVGGRLVRQPRNLPEALSTARMLEQRGYNFSLGLAQVNRYNLAKYGLDSYEKAFQPCANLQVGSRILAECYQRSRDWGKSFSCYYSGDFKTGYRHGYVQKVYASMHGARSAMLSAGAAPIAVIDRVQRRVASTVSRAARASGAEAVPADDSRAGRRVAEAPRSEAPASPVAQLPTTPQPEMFPTGVGSMPAPTTSVPPKGPVVLTATRLGQPSLPSTPTEAPTGGGDNAFVF
jgi:type IV secretion system protein VirB1